MIQEEKKVDVIVVEACKIDGKHIECDTEIKGMDANFAMELAGSGRVRVATDKLRAEVAERKKQAAAAAKAAAGDQQNKQ